MRHEISGGRQMTCHFCRVPPSPKEPCLSIHTERIWYATEQGTACVSDTICLWRGPTLHVKSDEKKQREGKEKKKEGRAKYIFNGKEAKGGYGKSSKLFPLSLALLYINCGTCKRQHYHLEAMSDCQFAIHFNNCHGPVRNYVSFNIGTEQKSTGRQTSRWNVVKAQNKLHARWITPRAITRRCFYAFHSFEFWISNTLETNHLRSKVMILTEKMTAQRKKSIKSLLNLIIAF